MNKFDNLSLDKNLAWAFLKQMITIRVVEETLLDLFSKGLLNGTVHTCIGQEGCAVGFINALNCETDVIFSNHRGHGHYITYGDDVRGLVAEIMGYPEGVCGGVGGSQHLQKDNFYTNGIQGASAPIVVGMALAEKLSRRNSVSVVFLGDGTFGEGAVYEAMNIASLWNLPVIFAVEHNHYAQTTPYEMQHAGDFAARANSFGIAAHQVDGMDVLAVYQSAKRIVAECRSTNRPQLFLMDTYRFAPHSKGDDYRNPVEIERYKERDPILLLALKLGVDDELTVARTEAKKRVDEIVESLLERTL
jgi:TPP-dependent pyruvate/acetoin dehydrogenase alpha subunit